MKMDWCSESRDIKTSEGGCMGEGEEFALEGGGGEGAIERMDLFNS